MKKIVTIGGGSGHFNLLRGLRDFDCQIISICPVTDSGGSTGILQKEYGNMGVGGFLGDAGKCLLALGNPELTNSLKYKFSEGPFANHSLKNILFAGLIAQADYEQALRTIQILLDIKKQHRVYPVSFESTTLHVQMGEVVISGETYIDRVDRVPFWDPQKHPIKKVWLGPEVSICQQAQDAIEKADYIFLAPGDLFTSILPVLLVKGVKESIQKSQAKLALFVNIMTKRGETDGFLALDIIAWIEKTLDKKLDQAIYNNSKIPEDIKKVYKAKEGKDPIVLSASEVQKNPVKYLCVDLLGSDLEKHIIHDSEKIKNFLKDYIK